LWICLRLFRSHATWRPWARDVRLLGCTNILRRLSCFLLLPSEKRGITPSTIRPSTTPRRAPIRISSAAVSKLIGSHPEFPHCDEDSTTWPQICVAADSRISQQIEQFVDDGLHFDNSPDGDKKAPRPFSRGAVQDCTSMG
jgi:hypothetical protein